MKPNGIKYKCPRCGHIYQAYTKTPPRSPKCYKCKGSLSTRHIVE